MTKIKSSQPKYLSIAESLIAQILGGQISIGAQLPTEKELCDRYQISRHTAREALRNVERNGLVERRQGSGTTVIRNVIPETVSQFINSINDLLKFGSKTRFAIDVTDIKVLDQDLAELLNVEIGDECIHVGGLRSAPESKEALCYSNIYRTYHKDKIDERLKHIETAVYAVAEALDKDNIGKIEQHISSCLMPADLADALDAKDDPVAMKIVRRYYAKNNKDLILVAESFYPSTRFSYSTILYPD